MRAYVQKRIPREMDNNLKLFKPELKTDMARLRALNKILEEIIYGLRK